eukprot:530543-Prorocentrum_minimum.AAC.10
MPLRHSKTQFFHRFFTGAIAASVSYPPFSSAYWTAVVVPGSNGLRAERAKRTESTGGAGRLGELPRLSSQFRRKVPRARRRGISPRAGGREGGANVARARGGKRATYVGCDLDEVALQLGLVPLCEHLPELLVAEAPHVLQDVVRLRDQLPRKPVPDESRQSVTMRDTPTREIPRSAIYRRRETDPGDRQR